MVLIAKLPPLAGRYNRLHGGLWRALRISTAGCGGPYGLGAERSNLNNNRLSTIASFNELLHGACRRAAPQSLRRSEGRKVEPASAGAACGAPIKIIRTLNLTF